MRLAEDHLEVAHRKEAHPKEAPRVVPRLRCPRAQGAAEASNTAKLLPATSLWSPQRRLQFAAPATRDRPDLLARRARRGRTERMETTGRTGTTGRTPKHCPHRWRSPALFARLDRQGHKARLDPRDRPDRRDRPESRRVMEFLASRECRDNPAQSAVQDVKDPGEPPASLAASSQCPARKEPPVLLARPESKDPRAKLDPTANRSKARPEPPEMRASPDGRDALVGQGLLGHPARTERRAPANTAQSHEPRQGTSPRLAAVEAAVAVQATTTDEGRVQLLCAVLLLARIGSSRGKHPPPPLHSS